MNIKIVIDNSVLEKYKKYYFKQYPKRRKFPIEKPIEPSLNQWMVMSRQKANGLKQKWSEFGQWLIEELGYKDKKIEKCNITVEYFFDSKRRHDASNYSLKFLLDSFIASGLLVDDDFNHVESLTIKGNYSKDNPRSEIMIEY